MSGSQGPAIPDGMAIDWDVPLAVRDGTILRADVYRPAEPGRYPVLLTHGPYGKWLSFAQGFPGMWKVLEESHPDALAGSSNAFQVWETPDPEKWVPHGYVCVRVDSRGAGRSPGFIDIFSPQETEDFYDCIEWAGVQGWSNGRVGLLGVSYYAMNQWQVAALNPPHLAAICPWEGASDYYREFVRHGGILSTFYASWYPATIMRVQHGRGERGERSTLTGDWVSGPATLTEEQLVELRPDWLGDIRRHALRDDYHLERTPDLSRIDVPTLSAANWAHHLHSRGNLEAFQAIGSPRKWLEVHGLEHWVHFYTDYGVTLQRAFFDHFLKGTDNGWSARPAVVLNVREVDGSFGVRESSAWPLPEAETLTLNLDAGTGALSADDGGAGDVRIDPLRGDATFRTAPLRDPLELAGTLAATLYVSTDAGDVDVFVTLRVWDEHGADVALRSALDPRGVVTAGWLRASHRALDRSASTRTRPVHPHDAQEPVPSWQPVRMDIELLPTSLRIPAGYRLGLTVGGSDFAFEGPGPWPELYGTPLRGNAIFLHEDPADRPPEIYHRPFRLHTGPASPSRLLLSAVR